MQDAAIAIEQKHSIRDALHDCLERCVRSREPSNRPIGDDEQHRGGEQHEDPSSQGLELTDQEQVVQLLSASDLFLMPSAQESFGLAALEAMACEVPVVASRVGGVPELVDDGVTGFLCPADDLDAMANASIRLLTDDALHARMSLGARARAVERFADSKIVPLYERFYDEVLGGG